MIHNPIEKNKKKGASAIEIVIGILIFFTLFAFFFDMFTITTKEFVVNRQVNLITRQMAIQGGVKRSMPSGFSGSSSTYINSSQLNEIFLSATTGSGIEPSEVEVLLTSYNRDGQILQQTKLNNTTNFEVNYEERFDVTVTYEYKWNILSQMVPGLNSTRTSSETRSNVSEFSYRLGLKNRERGEEYDEKLFA